MGRRTNRQELTEMVGKLRRRIPDIALRTTLITGFPGETQEDFEQLKDFVREMKFERLGVFAYSQEEDTPAAEMDGQIPEEIRQSRRNEIMELQQEIAFSANRSLIGREFDVMIEGRLPEENVYITRTYMDAPDVDGYVFVASEWNLMSGDFLRVRIIGADDYDLIGEIVEQDEE